MATSPVRLPPGFELETPQTQKDAKTAQIQPQKTREISLPSGFQLENEPRSVSSQPNPSGDSQVYQAAKKAQKAAGGSLGRAALSVASNPAIPTMISGTVAPLLKLSQMAVKHPREAAITAGAVAAPELVGPGLLTSSLASGAGAGAGSLAADVGEKALQSPTAPKTLSESLLKAGKVGGATAATAFITGAAFKVVGKASRTVMKAIGSAQKTANVEAAGKAIGEVEANTGLNKITLESFNAPAKADAYFDEIGKLGNVKDLPTDELYRLSKNAQTITRTYPKTTETPAGTRFFQKVQAARDELYSRVPDLGNAARAFGRELEKAAADKVAVSEKIKAVRTVKKLLRKALYGTATSIGLGAGYRIAKEVLP